MSYKKIVINALLSNHHTVQKINSPLDNEYIMDNAWLIEMDCDGAFAATVSPIKKSKGNYQDRHRLIIFCNINFECDEELKTEICRKVMNAIKSLQEIE